MVAVLEEIVFKVVDEELAAAVVPGITVVAAVPVGIIPRINLLKGERKVLAVRAVRLMVRIMVQPTEQTEVQAKVEQVVTKLDQTSMEVILQEKVVLVEV